MKDTNSYDLNRPFWKYGEVPRNKNDVINQIHIVTYLGLQ